VNIGIHAIEIVGTLQLSHHGSLEAAVQSLYQADLFLVTVDA
jgi:hypothetical protein